MISSEAILPTPLSSTVIGAADSVWLRMGGAEPISMPLSAALMCAVLCLRFKTPFAVGYEGDAIGQIIRSKDDGYIVNPELSSTVQELIGFLENYTDFIISRMNQE